MKFLVTGAGGLLGAYLVHYLYKVGYEVVALARHYVPRLKGMTSYRVDLVSEADRAKEIILDEVPDWVVHCAAMTDLAECEKRKRDAQLNNASATERISMVCSDLGCNMLYISTDNVYPGRLGGGFSETDLCYALNEYALSKQEGEDRAIGNYEGARQGQLLIVRESHYGWNAHSGQKASLPESIIRALNSGQSWDAWSNVFFSPIYCGSLCIILEQMMLDNMRGIFNVGCQERISKYQFASAVAEIWKLPFNNVHSTLYSPKAGEPSRPLDVSLNCRRAYSAGYIMPHIISDLEIMQDDPGDHRRMFE